MIPGSSLKGASPQQSICCGVPLTNSSVVGAGETVQQCQALRPHFQVAVGADVSQSVEYGQLLPHAWANAVARSMETYGSPRLTMTWDGNGKRLSGTGLKPSVPDG